MTQSVLHLSNLRQVHDRQAGPSTGFSNSPRRDGGSFAIRMGKLLMGSLLAAVGGALVASPALAEGRKPNFIIVLVDDLGYADTAPFGSKVNRTPNLSRLAAEGVGRVSRQTAPAP